MPTYNPESNCCEHGIQWEKPSHCVECLRIELAEARSMIVDLVGREQELRRLHEALLDTLTPSTSQWVRKVVSNARNAFKSSQVKETK